MSEGLRLMLDGTRLRLNHCRLNSAWVDLFIPFLSHYDDIQLNSVDTRAAWPPSAPITSLTVEYRVLLLLGPYWYSDISHVSWMRGWSFPPQLLKHLTPPFCLLALSCSLCLLNFHTSQIIICPLRLAVSFPSVISNHTARHHHIWTYSVTTWKEKKKKDSPYRKSMDEL